MRPYKAPRAVRLVARLALLSLIFQLSALGHWSFGPFHPDVGDMASHAAHCHGDISGCTGESSMTGSLTEVNLTPPAPAPRLEAVAKPDASLVESFIKPADKPPRIYS